MGEKARREKIKAGLNLNRPPKKPILTTAKKPILTFDHPLFDWFIKKLEKKLTSPLSLKEVGPGYFYKGPDGNHYFGYDEEKVHRNIIRTLLEEMKVVDVDATIKWFEDLETPRSCKECKYLFSLIRPEKTVQGEA